MLSICIISALFASAFYLLGFNFFIAFLIISGLITFIGTMFNKFIEYKTQVSIATSAAMSELATSYQSIKLPCSYCNVSSVIKYVFNSDNIFECPSCKCKNKIIVNMLSARTTEPLAANTVVDEVLKKIEEDDKNGRTI